jgi:Domain of unknown function (DUF4261)
MGSSTDFDFFHLTVLLLCEQMPDIKRDVLLEALKKRCPAAEPLDPSNVLGFAHPDHIVQLKDAAVPAATLVVKSEDPIDPSSLEPALQQSWKFPEARQAVQDCSTFVIVSEFMSSPLPYRERLDLFQAVVASTLEVVSCEAIHWIPTQQIVDPVKYLQDFNHPDIPKLFAGALNVRLFNVSGSEGDLIMDTLGLAVFGLPDLQCHYRGLVPKEVAQVLYDTALYVFENGDVIKDGHTVQGISADQKWRCQHEKALIAPERVVLDLNPGAPYAAGQRKS